MAREAFNLCGWIVLGIFLGEGALALPAEREPSVTGVVVDSSGAVVVDAQVSLSGSTGVEQFRQTDSQGRFEFRNLEAGEYQFTVQSPGFENENRTLQLKASEKKNLRIRLQVRVAGEVVRVVSEQEDYQAEVAQTATKTATPLEDLPFSVQVVTSQLLEDQKALRLDEALRNVSGTVFMDGGEGIQIFSRGFSATVLRDGFSRTEFTDGDVSRIDLNMFNVDRVEVLKGPASVLYGRGNPGGTVNMVTKRPLHRPYRRFTLTTDRFGLIRPSLDLSGPLNNSGNLRYRVNALFDRDLSFRDEVESQQFFLAPVFAWDLSPSTTLSFGAEYGKIDSTPDVGIPRDGDRVISDLPRDRFLGDPDDQSQGIKRTFSFSLDHGLNPTWQWRTAFSHSNTENHTNFTRGSALEDDARTLERIFIDSAFGFEDTRFQNDLIGSFQTNALTHQILIGFEAARRTTDVLFGVSPSESIDIFEPTYGNGGPSGNPFFVFVSEGARDLIGVYVQDQLALTERLTVVASGRFDSIGQEIESGLLGNTSLQPEKSDQALSPRAGLVYKPISQLSIYGNYSRSFQPQNGTPTAVDGSILEPEEGELSEIGAKYILPGGRLAATLAVYRLERENVTTPDLANPGFQIALGEQLSRGVELDLSGELLPGWRLSTAYAFTDAEILRDAIFAPGNRPQGIPSRSFNFWTTYRFQRASLQGLGFGGGILYMGERPGNNENSFQVPAFSRTDATVFYEWDRYLLQLNLRNIFDQEILLNPTRSNFFLPGEPFTALASLSVRF